MIHTISIEETDTSVHEGTSCLRFKTVTNRVGRGVPSLLSCLHPGLGSHCGILELLSSIRSYPFQGISGTDVDKNYFPRKILLNFFVKNQRQNFYVVRQFPFVIIISIFQTSISCFNITNFTLSPELSSIGVYPLSKMDSLTFL